MNLQKDFDSLFFLIPSRLGMMNNYTKITKTDNLRVLKSDEGQKISETFSELRGTRLVFRAP